MDYRRRNLTVNEVMSILEEKDFDNVQIHIEPPDACVDTDEDSADEDGEYCLLNNLSGRQLSATAEVILKDRTDPILDENEEAQEPARKKSKREKKKDNWKWLKKDVSNKKAVFPEPDYTKFRNLSPVEMFEMFFDDEVINLLVEESRKYALFKNFPNPEITKEEIKCFIAILIVSGYNKLPSERDYWDSQEDMRNVMVSNSMRRDRFLKIKKFIHCADNTNINKNDKFYKLRPLMDMLESKFLNNFVTEQNLSYDESMVPYYGRHSCKQFIRGKPIRFGYKVWAFNTISGYLVAFQPYQGKDPKDNEQHQLDFGKAAAPLIEMINSLPENKRNLSYNFFFDNLFTSLNLLSFLKNSGYNGTGTMRENRIPKSCPLTSKKEMKKKERGSYDYQTSKENIIVTHWVDNNVVTIASTQCGIEPLNQVQRFSKMEKKYKILKCPFVFKQYNKNMGSTDQMDENLSNYRISVRGKKWWWPIFVWLVDVSIQNAWVLYRKAVLDVPQKEFRRQIAQTYLIRNRREPKLPGPKSRKFSSSNSRISDEIRFDHIDHLVVRSDKKIRCAGQLCKSIMRTKCEKCNVGLCIDCFKSFHHKI